MGYNIDHWMIIYVVDFESLAEILKNRSTSGHGRA
jgi:hypothetical protein